MLHVDRNGQVGNPGLNPASINYVRKFLTGKIMRQSGLKTHTVIDRYSGAGNLDRGTTDAIRGELELSPETREPRGSPRQASE